MVGPLLDSAIAFPIVAGMGELHVAFMQEGGAPGLGSVVVGNQRALAENGVAYVGNIPTQGRDGAPVAYTILDGAGQVFSSGYIPIPYSFFGVAATLVVQGVP